MSEHVNWLHDIAAWIRHVDGRSRETDIRADKTLLAASRLEKLERDLNTCLRFMLPKDGEVWTKKDCGNGICSVGWSLGVGTHQIDESSGMSWGTIDQIACGCLVKEGDDG